MSHIDKRIVDAEISYANETLSDAKLDDQVMDIFDNEYLKFKEKTFNQIQELYYKEDCGEYKPLEFSHHHTCFKHKLSLEED